MFYNMSHRQNIHVWFLDNGLCRGGAHGCPDKHTCCTGKSNKWWRRGDVTQRRGSDANHVGHGNGDAETPSPNHWRMFTWPAVTCRSRRTWTSPEKQKPKLPRFGIDTLISSPWSCRANLKSALLDWIVALYCTVPHCILLCWIVLILYMVLYWIVVLDLIGLYVLRKSRIYKNQRSNHAIKMHQEARTAGGRERWEAQGSQGSQGSQGQAEALGTVE